LTIAIILVVVWMINCATEKYVSGRHSYRYGQVDTNPERRVSDAFDSPIYRNVYEGLPLP
jgi:hypothetical protein